MHALPWRAERAFLKAWPALTAVTHDNWQARFAKGLSRRANSVNPLDANATLRDADIRFFEDAYRAQNLPLIFRVPTLLSSGVDDLLAQSGFRAEGECVVLHGALNQAMASTDPSVSIERMSTREWLDAAHAMQGRTADDKATYEAIVKSIALPAGFATLREGGEPVALAYGAIDGDLLCIESVITAASHRGMGYGRRLMAALLHWARGHGAATACLQVEANNAAALALYRCIGLGGELYRYHYQRGRL